MAPLARCLPPQRPHTVELPSMGASDLNDIIDTLPYLFYSF